MRLKFQHKNSLRALLILVGLCLTACGTLTKELLKDPVVNVQTVTVSNISLEEMTLSVQLNVENPNPIPLTLDEVDYAMTFAGEPVAKGVFNKGIEIPSKGSNQVVVPMTFKYSSLGNLLANAFSNSLSKEYEFTGSARLGILKIPFHKKGEIKVKK